jgi:surface protein
MKIVKQYINYLIKRFSSDKIIARNKGHLEQLINEEIEQNGNNCDLNHIDVSKITNMSFLFEKTEFNGDVSQWDVSNVENMEGMFYRARFNGDISNWNTSNVKDMSRMFESSEFNSDISKWNTSKVENMGSLFLGSIFNGDISNWDVSNVINMRYMFNASVFSGNINEWKPYKLGSCYEMFTFATVIIPYWAEFDDKQARKEAIDKYKLHNDLKNDLKINDEPKKKSLKI